MASFSSVKNWRTLLSTVVLLLLWNTSAWLIAQHRYLTDAHQLISDNLSIAQKRADDLADSISRNLTYQDGIADLFAELIRVKAATLRFGPHATRSLVDTHTLQKKWTTDTQLTNLSQYLALAKKSLGVDLIYVLNAAGDSIADSNWDRQDSTIGHNFAERQFFERNQAGQRGMQYAVGKTTHIAGLYFSTPVMIDGKFMGAVVVKADVPNLSFLISQLDGFIADEYGVIILAHDKSLNMLALPDAAISKLSEQEKFFRYQKSNFPALRIETWRDTRFSALLSINQKNTPSILTSHKLPQYGLQVFINEEVPSLSSLDEKSFWFTIMLGMVGSMLILGIAAATIYFKRVTNDLSARKLMEGNLRNIASELQDAYGQIEAERASLVERVAERTAQLQYANKAKDSFLATMSHEIRTPLGGMLGMMELLKRSELNPEQHHQLEMAQLSGKNLLRIVNDILDWSKIEAGKLDLAPHNASIAEMMHGVASTYTQLASDKNITLKVTIDAQLKSQYTFDPLRLSQILNNFISNAIKFTTQGSVEISAQRLESRNGYDTVRFSVKDSGQGIGQEQQSRLFQHYEQATADIARMYGGTGLGLAICRRLAELMDGTLSVESTLGEGSTFHLTISLPVAAVTPPVKASANSQTETETSVQQDGEAETPLTVDGQPLAVLIADDHPVNRMLLKQQLGVLGVRIEAAESGTPALKLWQNSHFDIIITDCHMPEMDGYELTRKIRAMEQLTDKKRTPIIAWTANVLADEVERCHAAGMDDMLTKPTELADLRAMLVKWMGEK